MSRMSLESAKMVLRNRGFITEGDSHKGYRVVKDGIDHTTLITGRGVVKFAKEILSKEDERTELLKQEARRELLAELRANFEPGQTIVNVLKGERITV